MPGINNIIEVKNTSTKPVKIEGDNIQGGYIVLEAGETYNLSAGSYSYAPIITIAP